MRRSTPSITLTGRTLPALLFGTLGLSLAVSACGESELKATPKPAAMENVAACLDLTGAPPLEAITEDEPDLTPELEEARSQLESAIPAEMKDAGSLASHLGGDPAAIAEYLQTRVALEPYAGVLRGPMGTLWSGGGGPADRARLAAALLRAAGHEVRFAVASLAPEVADRLLQRAVERRRPPEVALELFRPLMERAAGHFLAVERAVSRSGLETPRTREAEWQRARERLADHVWVQFRKGSTWVDLDPTPGVEFGRSLVPATRTTPELDARLFHSFELAYEVEVDSAGERTRSTVLHYRAPTAGIPALPIGLYHASEEGKAAPRLALGSRVYRGGSFPTSVEPGSFGEAVAELGADIQNLLSRGAAALDSPGDDSPRAVAGWLHLCTDGPEGTRRVTHTVFDESSESGQRIAPDGTAYPTAEEGISALLGISLVTGPPSLATVSRAVLATGDPQTLPGAAGFLALKGLDYQLVREMVPTSFQTPLPRRYLNGPSVAVIRVDTGEDGQTRLTYDLASKAYRLLLGSEESPEEETLFFDYLFNGVLDHSVERVVAGEVGGVASLVEAALAGRGEPVAVLAGRDPASELPPDLSDEGRRRTSEALEAGAVVVLAPRRPAGWSLPLAWWEVDPLTGWTADADELGRGAASATLPQGVTEYTCMVKQGVANAFTTARTLVPTLTYASYQLSLVIYRFLISESGGMTVPGSEFLSKIIKAGLVAGGITLSTVGGISGSPLEKYVDALEKIMEMIEKRRDACQQQDPPPGQTTTGVIDPPEGPIGYIDEAGKLVGISRPFK